MLTNEELVALIQEGVNVTENMGLLYQQNIPLINKFVYAYTKDMQKSSVLEREDFMQEAYFGLYEAVQRYNPQMKTAFMTYARDYIKFAIVRYKQNVQHIVKVPEFQLQYIGKYKDFVKEHQLTNAGNPSVEEISKNLNLSVAKVKDIAQTIDTMYAVNLDEPNPNADNCVLGDIISDGTSLEDDVISRIAKNDKMNIVWGCVSRLEERKIAIIREHYKYGKSFVDIASESNLTDHSIYALHSRALNELSKMDELKSVYYDFDYESIALKNTGFSAWKDTWESSVERAVLKKIKYENNIEAIRNQLEKELSIPLHEAMPYIEWLIPLEQQIIKLRFVECKSFNEISQIIGINNKSVFYYRKKGIQHLKEFIKKEGEKQ